MSDLHDNVDHTFEAVARLRHVLDAAIIAAGQAVRRHGPQDVGAQALGQRVADQPTDHREAVLGVAGSDRLQAAAVRNTGRTRAQGAGRSMILATRLKCHGSK